MKTEYLLKICLIGTNFKFRDKLIRSIAGGTTDPNVMYLGVDISTPKITVNDTRIKLILFNSTQDWFKANRPNYYRGSSACIILFNKSDRESFEKVTYWLEDFRKYIPSPEIPITLLGINTDSEDVSKDEGKALAELLDLHYFETSTPEFPYARNIFVYLCEKVIK